MALNFNKYAAEGNEFIKGLAKELGYPDDTGRAGRVLKTVLHALRHQLTAEESVQLVAQLPMFLKAVYVDNWSLHPHGEKPKHYKEFFEEIQKLDGKSGQHDFPDDDAIDNAVVVVFIVLRKHVSLGELENIKAVLPKDLKTMLNTVLMI